MDRMEVNVQSDSVFRVANHSIHMQAAQPYHTILICSHASNTLVNSCSMGITTWKSSIWLLRVLYALYSLRRAGSFLQRMEKASIFSFISPRG
jgi:hypothetical protein